MKEKNILSVDWDFFFPNVDEYDWGHKESPLFMDLAWQWRCGDRNLLTHEYAIDAIHPDENLCKSFWQRFSFTPSTLIVTESHMDLYNVMKALHIQDATVWNFDAHHDIHYGNKNVINCDNWGLFGLKEKMISQYHVVYPQWRKNKTEGRIPKGKNTSVHYINDVLDVDIPFSLVFICRSSAWTPSWCDNKWLDFTGYWKQHKFLWRHRMSCGYVEKARTPDLEEAKKLSIQFRKMYDDMKERMKNNENKME